MKKLTFILLTFIAILAFAPQANAQHTIVNSDGIHQGNSNNPEGSNFNSQDIRSQVNLFVSQNGTTTRVPGGSTVLNYTQDGFGVDLNPMLNSIGFTVTDGNGSGNLDTILPSQSWDLAILQVHNVSLSALEVTAISNYIAGGGKLILSYWDLNNDPTLQAIVGVSNTISFNSPFPVSVWDGAHPIFNTPNTVSGLAVIGDIGGTDNGDRLEPSAGATALAGFVGPVTTNEAAIILANGGNTIFHGFSALDLDLTSYLNLIENEAEFLLGAAAPIAGCATDNPQAISSALPPTVSTFNVADSGIIGTNYDLNLTSIEITHTFDGDLDIQLQSPMGTILDLYINNSNSGDDFIATVFQDGGADITAASPPYTGIFEPEGGTFAAAFAGEDLNGNWLLIVTDNFGGDDGTLTEFCMGFLPIGVIGDPPVIACPADVSVDTDPGVCEAVVNFTDAVALDTEDGAIATTQTMGPPSGSAFPTGDTIIEFSATDSDNNTVTCQFTITVTDNELPVAVCQDMTVTLDALGMATIIPADLDAGSTDNCTGATVTLSQTTFDCSDVGAVIVTLTITDLAGNVATCDATVTVVDDTAPIIACIGEPTTIVGSTSAVVGDPIPDNDPAGASWTMTVTDDFDIVDLDVSLDITHTWVGDLIVTIESPAGTQVTIVDRPGVPASGAGCAGDDILATLDDEATLPVEDECDGGTPTITGSFIPNEALSAFDGEGTMGDWIITISDNAGGDQGTLNSWGILYSHDVTGSPLEVDLDAMGMATIDASDLIMGVDEACGYTVTIGGGGAPMPATLTTTFAGGNNFNGNMFDIMAINDLTIDSFDINLDTGTTDDIEVWFRTGSFIGFETSNAGWTLLDTAVGITSSGAGVATPLNLNLGQVVAAGDLVAFYVTTTLGGTIFYTNGTAQGNLFASDANLEFYEGNGGGYFAVNFTPRVFNGNIQYSTGGGASTTIDFDCSNLGENIIEVTVTDASGNVSTCMATVNVNDVTAPIITCVGPTIPTETGTVSDAPGMIIDDNTTQSTTITVTDDFPITDLNVDLDITHTWVGDLQITLESPAGTQVLIFDGAADGCDEDDFVGVTLDDESANALVCGAAPAFTGDYMPSNALAAFDGESMMGDWILSIEDTAGGDDGVLNTWGLTYSYDGVPTIAFPIELDENGEATIDPLDLLASIDEACGIDVAAADITDFTCADIGTVIDVTVFVSDASGNIAACVAQVMVVDLLAPVLTCPADQTQDPGPGNLFWEVPDFFTNGEATATDNCTDPVVITTQDPAAGTLLSDGVYTVTITAEDEYGNLSTCDFELTIESILGAQDNELNNAIAIYPNPANDQFTISNSSNIVLDNAMIYDINGKLVSQINLQDMQSEKVVNIADYASGVYMVYITGEQSSVVKRLIKE